MEENKDLLLLQAVDRGLEEVDTALRQMLLLSELSAGDSHVDRAYLQQVLERLQRKIDRIADQLEKL